ncbi:hypothetical protein LOZ57_003833 [Ophidiomyces ophidiicola]|uniref:uncharacterized protein n=1 Tax=Ophidiomyces ophidiicola TaxID=1387563 RepID=UPI0020C25411|nr:uncharacterized protein LOZ57_003833 [Ophidiomyces ophidiicola]KAI1946082.1 hypothetical protein LOZ57_003833 [Ophidiomyces ophidiicola]KAI2057470.1 hypothetical protein LOZ43_003085 [Ophidiomyces ophidiicola]
MSSSRVASHPPIDLLRPPSCRRPSHETGASHRIFMDASFAHSPKSTSYYRAPDAVPPQALPSAISLFLKSDDPKSQASLSSIATASLRKSASSYMDRSRQLSPRMAGADRRGDGEHTHAPGHRSNLQAARDALGAAMGVNRDDPKKFDSAASGVHSQSTTEPASRSHRRSPSEQHRGPSPHRASPASMPDTFGNGENSGSLMNSTTVASPGPIEEDNPLEERSHRRDEEAMLEDSNKAFSYPVPVPNPNLNDPRRGMSLPHSGLNKGSPRSPSTKKHRCPYCSTEFTRHHNLKSHLLTHSQEKPYVCQTCQSRFRRLHDLKRHTKLHTGERPHICPKCGRRFARGDALARHNKGSGGCAGRRSSMSGYGGEDDYGEHGGSGTTHADDAMEGLMYTEPERMDDDDERRLSIPSIRKDNVTPEPHSRSRHVSFSSHQSSTYPPIGGNRSPGGLLPPVSSHAGSVSPSPISPSYPPGSSSSSSFNPGHQGSSPSIFVQTNMTESPKPLSPAVLSPHPLGSDSNTLPPPNQPQQQLTPGHSPNLKPQFQSGQPHFNRNRQNSGASLGVPSITGPGPLSLPSPQSTTPHLPPPPGLNPPESRFTLHSQGLNQQSQGPISSIHSVNNRTDSLGRPSHPPVSEITNPDSSNINHNMFSQQRQASLPSVGLGIPPNDRMWEYVRSLESRMNGLEAEVGRLREQLAGNGTSGTNGA